MLDRFPDSDETPLPSFNETGVLPPGDYFPTRDEFETRFVGIEDREARARIYAGWNRHRAALAGTGLTGHARQLLDGSFTTSKRDPEDIDIAVEFPTTSAELSSMDRNHPVFLLLLGPAMKSEYSCDAYPIYALPEDDPQYESITRNALRYWTKWFGRTRLNDGGESIEKGRVWARTSGFR